MEIRRLEQRDFPALKSLCVTHQTKYWPNRGKIFWDDTVRRNISELGVWVALDMGMFLGAILCAPAPEKKALRVRVVALPIELSLPLEEQQKVSLQLIKAALELYGEALYGEGELDVDSPTLKILEHLPVTVRDGGTNPITRKLLTVVFEADLRQLRTIL